MSAPLSEQQLAEIRGLDLLGLVGERNAGRISAHFAVLLAEVARLKSHLVAPIPYRLGEDQLPDELAEQLVALLAEALRQGVPLAALTGGREANGEMEAALTRAMVRHQYTVPGLFPSAAEQAHGLRARVAELEAERHSTNEALSDAAEALRDANTAAGLVAEYHLPTAGGRWLSVRREPNGDRWCVMAWALRGAADRRSMAWVGGRWQTLPAYGENGVWEYASADAALAEATRLTEAGEPR